MARKPKKVSVKVQQQQQKRQALEVRLYKIAGKPEFADEFEALREQLAELA